MSTSVMMRFMLLIRASGAPKVTTVANELSDKAKDGKGGKPMVS
jgi:hypothetical protein